MVHRCIVSGVDISCTINGKAAAIKWLSTDGMLFELIPINIFADYEGLKQLFDI